MAPACCELYVGSFGNRTRLLGLPSHLLGCIPRDWSTYNRAIVPIFNCPADPTASSFRPFAGVRSAESPDDQWAVKWCATKTWELIGHETSGPSQGSTTPSTPCCMNASATHPSFFLLPSFVRIPAPAAGPLHDFDNNSDWPTVI